MTEQEWDIALTDVTDGGSIKVNLPRMVARALRAKNYNRAVLRITDQGLLLQPYASDRVNNAVADLPETWQ